MEDAFWEGLRGIARRDERSIADLVTEVDEARAAGSNLSSAIRLFVLDRVRRQAA